jgi:hypothetical protein
MNDMKKNLLAAFLSILLTLVLAEIVLRFFPVDTPKPQINQGPKTDWAVIPERVWTEYHPELGWYHMKNKTALLELKGLQVEIHTNSEGFRGIREYAKNKPEGVYRIIVLGDSFPFGFGVRDEESFLAVLESRYQKLEVINLCVPGYGIDQMLMVWRTIASQYEADMVVIGIFPEDFWRATRSFADSGHAKPYFTLTPDGQLSLKNVPVPPKYQLDTNQFPDLIAMSRFEQILMESKLYRLLKKGLIRLLGKKWGIIDPDTDEEWLLGRVILKTLVAEIRQKGIRPVIFIMPPERWVQSERKDSLLKSLYRFAAKEKVEMVDPTREFYAALKQSAATDYYIKDDWHWTAKGHRLAADIFQNYLSKYYVEALTPDIAAAQPEKIQE